MAAMSSEADEEASGLLPSASASAGSIDSRDERADSAGLSMTRPRKRVERGESAGLGAVSGSSPSLLKTRTLSLAMFLN